MCQIAAEGVEGISKNAIFLTLCFNYVMFDPRNGGLPVGSDVTFGKDPGCDLTLPVQVRAAKSGFSLPIQILNATLHKKVQGPQLSRRLLKCNLASTMPSG